MPCIENQILNWASPQNGFVVRSRRPQPGPRGCPVVVSSSRKQAAHSGEDGLVLARVNLHVESIELALACAADPVPQTAVDHSLLLIRYAHGGGQSPPRWSVPLTGIPAPS